MALKLVSQKDCALNRLVYFLDRFGAHPYLLDSVFHWPGASKYLAGLIDDYKGRVILAVGENGDISGLIAFQNRKWDSDFWGWPVGTIDYFYVVDGAVGEETAGILAKEVGDWAEDRRIRFVSGKVYPNAKISKALEDNEFYKVIDEFRLSKKLTDWDLMKEPDKRIRYFQPNDLDDLLRIAEKAPWAARFHSDSHFKKERADSFYVSWLRNAVGRSDAKITVLEDDGRPAGFVVWSCKRIPTGDLVGDQELVAIDPVIRGRGLGKILYRGVLSEMRRADVDLVETVIAAENAPALHIQKKLGLEPNYKISVFHRFN